MKRKTYAAMVSAVDDGIGEILDALQQNGNLQNTLVIFLSDNGGPEKENGSTMEYLGGKEIFMKEEYVSLLPCNGQK